MKRKTALFIGRWQPPHDGHKKLIQRVLKENKNIIIAIRDTKLNEENPYSYKQRKAMFLKLLRNHPLVKIIKIPDINEICYGRKTGYRIREIRLAKKWEDISGTNIRKKLNNRNQHE
ncbi:MAG: adenylyltransferase/cytidyltransferase family protein [Candidatus Moranbacteria bacterium]|nr:adenylyltransferase/cytidyltransferase family protein [Candidatus Moranbacteria bacterium]